MIQGLGLGAHPCRSMGARGEILRISPTTPHPEKVWPGWLKTA